MIKKKILMVSTYPIANPLHGGQKRVNALHNFYRSLFSEVRFAAVYHATDYQQHGPDDIAVTDKTVLEKIKADPFAGDVVLGEAIMTDESVRAHFAGILKEFQPDVIQVEHIYPWVGLEPLLESLGLQPKIILSSHNIEAAMKRDIFTDLKVPAKKRDALVAKLEELEQNITQKADLVIAVNQADALSHQQLGARRCIVIANGIDKIVPTNEAVEHWKKFKADTKTEKLVTFVGSAHPPNLVGFQDLMGTDLSFLPEDSKLMLAGGISDYMQQEYPEKQPSNKKFWQRAQPLGRLSDDLLAGLIAESDVLLLPITSGGGSNLKTAEAILSGKKIVSTSLAFRSFENYLTLPNIHVTDAAESFRTAVIDALQEPYVTRTPKQVTLADRVQWQHCFEGSAKVIEQTITSPVAYYVARARRLLGRVKSKLIAR